MFASMIASCSLMLLKTAEAGKHSNGIGAYYVNPVGRPYPQWECVQVAKMSGGPEITQDTRVWVLASSTLMFKDQEMNVF